MSRVMGVIDYGQYDNDLSKARAEVLIHFGQVKELRQRIAELEAENAAQQRGLIELRSCPRLLQESQEEVARLAAQEHNKPVAWINKECTEVIMDVGTGDLSVWSPLFYAAQNKHIAELERRNKVALEAMKEAYKLRDGLCRHGDDKDIPTDPILYDSYLKKWGNAIKELERSKP